MDEYTFDNVIVNPFMEGIESLIGKEVYFHDNPFLCLKNANDKSPVMSGILVEICRVSINPFLIKLNDGAANAYSCIIEKKEPESKYVPFKSMEEFIDKYSEVVKGIECDSFEDGILQWGMWLKYIDDNDKPVYTLVCEIKDEGVKLDEHGRFTWEELLSKGFLFPNDTPCGKEKK